MFSFSIDRGGTFTDIYCEFQNKDAKKIIIHKLLSQGVDYKEGPIQGIKQILHNQIGPETFNEKQG